MTQLNQYAVWGYTGFLGYVEAYSEEQALADAREAWAEQVELQVTIDKSGQV